MSRISVKAVRQIRFNSNTPLYLNPHTWENLPADRIFELHNLRKDALKENYNPNDEERRAILSTFQDLSKVKPTLDYVYEIDNFKERFMNNTPARLRGLPPKRSNVNVVPSTKTLHDERRKDHLNKVMAFEMPLLAKYRQPYTPKTNKETPIKLTYHSDFSNDSNNSNRKVTLTVALKDLALNEKQQKKFIILSGNKINHETNILKFSVDESEQPTQNARIIVERFNKLVEAAKDLTDDFADIPIDIRSTKMKKKLPVFPKEWKKPQDAPIVSHNITRKLVDLVKSKKDDSYVSTFKP
ncbi:37S ribosomal protein S24, mitochondrial [[Candida] jaroonii]|uniref:37S ribosomal protein S24, mitochondrial n=1 Tax=[Candida] jaroonii TaxID=467808 RepID=A0ACA9XZZ4_9ASCO|nr:37S ribosomal protein S24, mitochondrial [[Candida] jaroonii]